MKEIVIGMAHRGRLNVLANVMSKPYRQLFHEFSGGSANPQEVQGSGDVKYHLGASSDRQFDNHNVHLSLTANPSHLEASDPVVLGKARAKQQQREGHRRTHQRAAAPAARRRGVRRPGRGRGMLLHERDQGLPHRRHDPFHHHNQIGFTTSPAYSRSSPYCTDIALMVQAPIFHVNGDDPEAVVHCARIATEFRQLFHKDVVIDMVCYRRFGHNETLEPTFSQPLMYKADQGSSDDLADLRQEAGRRGHADPGRVRRDEQGLRRPARRGTGGVQEPQAEQADWLDGRWSGLGVAPKGDRRGDTRRAARRRARGRRRADPSAARFPTCTRPWRAAWKPRTRCSPPARGFDWSTAEALAFGTLMLEGMPIRFSGQDSTEGTFSQRHAALVDQQTEKRYYPLANIRDGQANFEIIDSLLSEEAVLGFEYGYSSAEPKALTLWEAQFGDFANGAQVIIDQFIASGETKWLRMVRPRDAGCRTVMRARGPEHSSARLERYLQLCARTTSRSPIARHRRTISTSCAARCTGRSASR
ncbi:MAG: thiamine pyrophosphate-dependent enzyme [Rhizomicrobium sp.]